MPNEISLQEPVGLKLLQRIDSHPDIIESVAWSPSGSMIASQSHSPAVGIWSVETGRPIHVLEVDSRNVTSLAWSNDSSKIATGSASGDIRVWNVADGKLIRKLEGHKEWVTDLSWSPSGHLLATRSLDETVRLWKTNSWNLQHKLVLVEKPIWGKGLDVSRGLAWSPDGRYLAVGVDRPDSIKIWDTKQWKPTANLLGHENHITCVAWSPTVKLLASAAEDTTVRIWSTLTWEIMEILEHDGASGTMAQISFSKDGYLLATKNPHSDVLLWLVGSWEKLLRLSEPANPYSSRIGVSFHPYKRSLATVDYGKKAINIWEISLESLLGENATSKLNEARKLMRQHQLHSYSCFISYSSHDYEFAKKLHDDLDSQGVNCWFAPKDMRIGDKIRQSIDSAISKNDKLLLVLSGSSVNSQWVEQEVETALEKERIDGNLVLFPIRIDDVVFASDEAWARFLKNTRNIGDFRDWQKDLAYNAAFRKLLDDLKTEIG